MNLSYKFFVAFIVATFLFSIGATYGQDRSNTYLDSVKHLVQKLSSDSERVNTLIDISKGISCDDSTKKIALAVEAKRISENINWPKGIRNSNNAIALIYVQCQKQFDRAFEYLNANVEYAKKNKDIHGEAVALEVMAKEYSELNQHQHAIDYYYMVLDIHPGTTAEAIAYGNIGNEYKAVNDYLKALNFYDSSYARVRSKKAYDINDTFELAGLNLNRGEIYLYINKTDKALAHYDSVLNSAASAIDKHFKVWALIGKGRTFRSKKEYQKAIEIYQEALSVARQVNSFEEEVNIDVELANIYVEMADLTKALAYGDSAIYLAETQHFISSLSKCYTTLGNIYLKQDKNELAISYLLKAQAMGKQTRNLVDQKDALNLLITAFRKTGQLQNAIDAKNSFDEIRDSLFNIDKLNAITRLELNKDFKLRQQIDSIRSQAIFDKKIERQKIFTYSGLVALLLVVLLSFFIYRSYVIQKKYNELLSKEKKTHLAHIEAQSNVLSEISHIQAHQIRGPVSTILGLVHIFNYEDPADPMNKQVMEWITSTTEKLDTVIKEVIQKENDLRSEHEEEAFRRQNPES